MTSTTRDLLVCECGHQGHLQCRENDQPHSRLWMAYSLEEFKGGSLTITSIKDAPKDILAHLKPTCPACGQSGKVRYV